MQKSRSGAVRAQDKIWMTRFTEMPILDEPDVVRRSEAIGAVRDEQDRSVVLRDDLIKAIRRSGV